MKPLAPCIASAVLLAAAIASAAVAQSPGPADLEKAVASIAAYEDGKDFSGLRAVEALLRTQPKDSAVLRDLERRLAALIAGQATAQGKAEACKFLWIIGSEDSLPALAKLLDDEALAEFACVALTHHPAPGVNAALRNAVATAKGPGRVAVITLLGDRRDPEAVTLLAPLAARTDANADAAVFALGKIGTPEAAAALAKARSAAKPPSLPLLNASLRCAFRLAEAGKTADADALCKELLDAGNPLMIRRGAFLERCRLAGGKSAALILAVLNEGPEDLRGAAAAEAASIQDRGELDKVIDAYSGMPVERQALVVAALGRSRPEWVRPLIDKAAHSPEPALRRTALSALARVGNHQSVATFIAAFTSATDPQERAVVLAALAQLPGDEAGKAILDAATKASARDKADLLGVLADRGVKECLPLLQASATAPEPELRKAALRGLPYLSGPESLPKLIDMLVSNPAGPPQPDVEKAIVVLATKIDPPSARTAELRKTWQARSEPGVRAAIARIFAALATDEALQALQESIDSADPALRDAAVRAILTWPDIRAQAAVEKIILQGSDEKHRILAIRSLSEILRKAQGTHVKIIGQVLAASPSPAVAKESLASLAQVRHPASLKLAASQLKNPALAADAATTVATIAAQLEPSQLAGLKPLLQAALQAADPSVRPQLESAVSKAP